MVSIALTEGITRTAVIISTVWLVI